MLGSPTVVPKSSVAVVSPDELARVLDGIDKFEDSFSDGEYIKNSISKTEDSEETNHFGLVPSPTSEKPRTFMDELVVLGIHPPTVFVRTLSSGSHHERKLSL